MLYRRFGKTEIKMPVLTFGAMRSMKTWDEKTIDPIDQQSQQNLKRILDTSLKHGINHIETAHGYGSSEFQLGQLLPEYNREELIIQTKVGPEDDPDKFIDNFKLSLSHLQVDHVDLLSIHGINNYHSLWQSCKKNGCLAAARKLQQQGYINHVGFSGHGPCDVIMEAIRHEEDGGFDFVNLHWYYILDVNRPAIDLAAERDLGVYIISPTDKGGRLWDPSALIQKKCAPLSPMVFNDTYCLMKKGVSSIGVGAAEPGHFDEHLKAVELLEKPETEKLIGQIDQKLKAVMQKNTGFERPDNLWDRLPSWEDSPKYINISMAIWLFNLAKGWDLTDYARTRYKMLASTTRWVPGNDCTEAANTDFTEFFKNLDLDEQNIVPLLKEAHELLAQ